jgi:hypothetical protein
MQFKDTSNDEKIRNAADSSNESQRKESLIDRELT